MMDYSEQNKDWRIILRKVANELSQNSLVRVIEEHLDSPHPKIRPIVLEVQNSSYRTELLKQTMEEIVRTPNMDEEIFSKFYSPFLNFSEYPNLTS